MTVEQLTIRFTPAPLRDAQAWFLPGSCADDWLADMVYSSVPASRFGARQIIEISPVSGLSNVKYWLEENGYDSTDSELCARLFEYAKTKDRTLKPEECHSVARGSDAVQESNRS